MYEYNTRNRDQLSLPKCRKVIAQCYRFQIEGVKEAQTDCAVVRFCLSLVRLQGNWTPISPITIIYYYLESRKIHHTKLLTVCEMV